MSVLLETAKELAILRGQKQELAEVLSKCIGLLEVIQAAEEGPLAMPWIELQMGYDILEKTKEGGNRQCV